MRTNYLLLLLISLAIIGCNSDEEDSFTAEAIELGTFRLATDNKTYSIESPTALFNNSSNITLDLGGGSSANNVSEAYQLTISSTGGVTPELKSYQMDGQETCFNPNDLCAYLIYQKVDIITPTNNLLLSSLTPGGNFEIEITEVDWQPGGLIKGTFSGKLTGNNTEANITEGAFYVEIDE